MRAKTTHLTTIAPDTRIGDLLKTHPDLLDVLAGYAPAFDKLRNPLLRRTVGRMATLAQAASLGGVDLGGLLGTLRQAAGEPEPLLAPLPAQGAAQGEVTRLPLSAATPDPPAWLAEERVVSRFDARPLHAEGQNPIAPILQAARAVPEGAIFCLHNSFEPLPLYEVLGQQGFVPWARQAGPEDWEVFFYRARPGEAAGLSAGGNGRPVGENDRSSAGSSAPPVASVTIDVSQLTPPEPMQRVLEALAGLEPGQTLRVRHVQRPLYLYGKLEEMGHSHQTWEMGPGHVEILIRVGSDGKEER